MTMPRMRHAVQVGLALSLLRWAFVDPAASPRHTAASPSPRRSTSVTALRATWREVHQDRWLCAAPPGGTLRDSCVVDRPWPQEAKDLEQKLREVIIESNQRVRELEGMFVERSKASDEKAFR
eukprot:g20423.t1